ncbi:hypothetical protein ACFP2T_31555 [Plantactinospora solaniradicis]|uniref:Uncharacterized protein n=1 Tax=Plantactinospora solaniradicis TaxID=1723736 RepID=A0ABW1KHK6_9ACTN
MSGCGLPVNLVDFLLRQEFGMDGADAGLVGDAAAAVWLSPVSSSGPAAVRALNALMVADPAAVIGGLPPDPRPLPSVAHYDELLKLRRPPSPPVSGPPANPGRVS